jgi:hypothetical protein
MMRILLASVLAFAMCGILVGCGGNDVPEGKAKRREVEPGSRPAPGPPKSEGSVTGVETEEPPSSN